jgi:hypothetical protein
MTSTCSCTAGANERSCVDQPLYSGKLHRRSSRHSAKAIEMDRCKTASLPATLAQPPKTTAVMAGSNVGTLNRMRGSDAIGRVDYCPPSGRARTVSDQRRSRGLTQFLPRPVLSSFQTAET